MASRRGSGEGSVFFHEQRQRWCVDIDYGYVNGKRKRVRRFFKTRREATAYLTSALKARQDGTPPPDGRTRLGDHLDQWMAMVVSPSDRAEATKASYENAVRLHLKPGLGHHRLIDLRHEHVQRFINGMRDEGSGRSLMNTTMVVLRLALKQAVIEERITRNVARDVEVPSALVATAPPRRLTPAERTALIRAVRGDRLFGLYYLLAATGLRRGEGIGLRVQDIDFERETLHIRQQIVRVTGKGLIVKLPKGEKTRSTFLSERMASVLRARLALREAERSAAGDSWVSSDLVFTTALGTALDPSRLNHHMDAVCRRAGIAHAAPHALRRTFSDQAHAAGARDKDLQAAMGHSTLAMTMDGYVGTRSDVDRAFVSITELSLADLDDLLADNLADSQPPEGLI